jgi:hypothetical protein
VTQAVARPTLHDVGRTMVGQLYDAVCGGDASVPPAEDAFLTWCRPGLPLPSAAAPRPVEGDAAPRPVEGDAAPNVAALVDFVPSVAPSAGDGRGAGGGGAGGGEACDGDGAAAGPRLSVAYAQLLRRAAVVHGGLSAEERLKVEKFRNLLRTTRRLTDRVTGAEREVTEDGPMLRAYLDKQAGYLAAALRYNLHRVTGRDGAGAERRVRTAMDAWVCLGYRNEVDQVNAYLDQVSQRDLVPLRHSLVQMYDDALLGCGNYHTTLVPGDLGSDEWWSDYELRAEARDIARPGSWRAGADVDFGYHGVELGEFAVSFRLAQVVISRPWFYPGFLTNRGWTLRDGELASDGGDPPRGGLVGYPAAALVARDLRICSPEFSAAHRRSGGHWGPFRLDGARVDPEGLAVPGMQVIGFVNRLVGRAPNPLPELDQERFV